MNAVIYVLADLCSGVTRAVRQWSGSALMVQVGELLWRRDWSGQTNWHSAIIPGEYSYLSLNYYATFSIK